MQTRNEEEERKEQIKKKYQNNSYEQIEARYYEIQRLLNEHNIDPTNSPTQYDKRNSSFLNWACTGNNFCKINDAVPNDFQNSETAKLKDAPSNDEMAAGITAEVGTRIGGTALGGALLPLCPLLGLIILIWANIPDSISKEFRKKVADYFPPAEILKEIPIFKDKYIDYAKGRDKELEKDLKADKEIIKASKDDLLMEQKVLNELMEEKKKGKTEEKAEEENKDEFENNVKKILSNLENNKNLDDEQKKIIKEKGSKLIESYKNGKLNEEMLKEMEELKSMTEDKVKEFKDNHEKNFEKINKNEQEEAKKKEVEDKASRTNNNDKENDEKKVNNPNEALKKVKSNNVNKNNNNINNKVKNNGASQIPGI